MKKLLSLLVVILPGLIGAQPILQPGHYVVGNILAPGGPSDLVAVNPATNQQWVLSRAANYPTGVAFDALGALFVTDLNQGQILRIDRRTGEATEVCERLALSNPLGLAVGTNGELYVNDRLPLPAVRRINPGTGAISTVSTGGLLTEPSRIAADADGTLLVSDGRFTSAARILRIDPVTGVQSVVTSGDQLYAPTGIAVATDGGLLVADSAVGLVHVARTNGQQTLVSAGACEGVVVDAAGGILITAQGPNFTPGGVFAVNPQTGARVPVSIGGDFAYPVDIAIANGVPDADGDGVIDDQDQCLDTAPGAMVDVQGCSLDQLVPCAGPVAGRVWANHGDYVSAYVRAAADFLAQGQITTAQFESLVATAARSRCGK